MTGFIIHNNTISHTLLQRILEPQGFRITIEKDFNIYRDKSIIKNTDFIILSTLKDNNQNFKYIKQIREISSDIYILFIDKCLNFLPRVKLIENGADDVLVFPLRPEELIAKLRSFQRRPKTYLGNTIVKDDIKIDIWKRRVFYRGREIDLRNREFDLLLFMIQRYGQAISRRDIENNVWQYRSANYSNT